MRAEQSVWISEGATRSRALLTYSISRAELGQLAVEVPADYKVVNVFDANVRQWSVEPLAAGAKRQKITAQLFEPAKRLQQVVVELEKFAGEKLQPSLTIPVIKALDVGRQQGVVLVDVAAGLRAEATRTAGLLQIDASELPPALANAVDVLLSLCHDPLRVGLGRRRAAAAGHGRLAGRSAAGTQSVDAGRDGGLHDQRAGVFKLELDVPPDFHVRQVRGCELPGGNPSQQAAAVQVDSHRLEGEKKNRLVVNLAHKALGRVALAVQLQKDLQEANLLAPTGKASDIPIPVPQVAANTVERATGRLLIYAPDSLRINPGKTEGLRGISFQEALEGMSAAPPPSAAQGRPGARFRLYPGARHASPGRRAEKSPGEHSPDARGEGRTGHGQVSSHLPLHHPL